MQQDDYIGAKLVLLIGDRLLTILRDDKPGIDHPGEWDLPGGGREAGERPLQTILRETREEVGLGLEDVRFAMCEPVASRTAPGLTGWWFAAQLPASAEAQVVLGDEGQRWALMAPGDWLADPGSIAHFRPRVRAGLAALGRAGLLGEKISCRTPTEGRDGVTRIPLWKYRLLRGAILEVLTERGALGLRFGELADALRERLAREDLDRLGSLNWHMTVVKLNMEVEGEIRRLAGRGPQRIVGAD